SSASAADSRRPTRSRSVSAFGPFARLRLRTLLLSPHGVLVGNGGELAPAISAQRRRGHAVLAAHRTGTGAHHRRIGAVEETIEIEDATHRRGEAPEHAVE